MKLTEEQMIQLWREDGIEEDGLNLEVVENGSWVDGGKYSNQQVVFKDVDTGKHYAFEIIRSGSYFSHYEYEAYDSPREVELVEEQITVRKWV